VDNANVMVKGGLRDLQDRNGGEVPRSVVMGEVALKGKGTIENVLRLSCSFCLSAS
jgi:hypothetical protein